VSLTGANRRDDDEIRGAALQNLIWDVEVSERNERGGRGSRRGCGGHRCA
jgi:hypothetical protein